MQWLIEFAVLQLNPSLSEPLYLVANRLTLHYLSELNDVVDFGFNDKRHISIVDAEDVYYKKSSGYILIISTDWEFS